MAVIEAAVVIARSCGIVNPFVVHVPVAIMLNLLAVDPAKCVFAPMVMLPETLIP